MAHAGRPLPHARLVEASPVLRASERTALPNLPARARFQLARPELAVRPRRGSQHAAIELREHLGDATVNSSWTLQEPIGIEVLPPEAPPADADVPLPSAEAPAALPVPPKKVSEADVRKAIQSIVKEHPPGRPPLDEESLVKEVERRVDARLARERASWRLEMRWRHTSNCG
jgi:hypothetical protein